MKITFKQFNESVVPALNQLDPNNPATQGAVSALMQQIESANKGSKLSALSEKIAEYEDSLKELQLKRAIKQLRAAQDQESMDIQPVQTQLSTVPSALEKFLLATPAVSQMPTTEPDPEEAPAEAEAVEE